MSPFTKWVDIGDPHGDHIDPVVEKALFAFLSDFKPDVVVHGGDNWDFPQLRKKASQQEQDQPMDDDWDMGMDFIDRYFSFGKRRIFLRGNHDERLWDLLKDGNGPQRKLAEDCIRAITTKLKLRKAEMRPYDSRLGVLEEPGLPKIIHGYAHGEGSAKQFAQIYGTCLFSHTHAADIGVAKRYPKPSVAVGTGCLCVIDQPYNSRNTGKLRHENCWAYGYTSNGESSIFQARREGDSFYAATEIQKY